MTPQEKRNIALLLTLSQQVYGSPTYFDAESGEILRWDQEAEAFFPIVPSGDTTIPSPIWHIEKSRLLSASDLLRSENSGDFRDVFGTKTDENRTETREENGNISEEKPVFDVNFSEPAWKKREKRLAEERRRLFRTFSLEEFHSLYSEPIRSLALRTEELCFEIITNTTKDSTIEKVLAYFREAARLAQEGDEYHLRKLVERLEGKRRQQLNMQAVNEKLERKAAWRRKLKIAGVTLLLTAGIITAGWFFVRFNWSLGEPHKSGSTVLASPTSTYYIVIGSYKHYNIAEKRAKMHGAQILSFGDTLWRLSVAHFATKDSAKAVLYQYRETYPQAWVLKTETN